MKKYLHFSVVKKDLTRFAPLWGLYSVLILIFLLLMWEDGRTGAYMMNLASEVMAVMSSVNLVYAFLCAVVLLGDLFHPRLCNMLHAMPVSREGWFVTHLVSGLLFCLIPSLLGSLVAAAMLGSYAYGAFLWLALTVLQFLFFFGIGVFSAMCAGTKLGAAAVYALIHFFSVVMGYFAKVLFEPLLYGVTVDFQKFTLLCPAVTLVSNPYIEVHYDNMKQITVVERIPLESWLYLGIAAAVGVAFLVCALLLYRKRHMETAGDMISWRPVAPVFLTVYALCIGVFLYSLGVELGGGMWLLLFAGLAIGFFTGRMLLEKQVKVFCAKNLLGFGVFVVLVAAVLFTVKLDPVGITRYVPEKEQVESVIVSPYSTQYSLRQQSCTLTESEDVEIILQLHRDAINDPHQGNRPVNLRYRLTDGRVINRSYYVGYKPKLQTFYSRPESVMQGYSLEEVLESAVFLEVYPYDEEGLPYVYIGSSADFQYIDDKMGDTTVYKKQTVGGISQEPVAAALIKAIYDDCEAGGMSQWGNDRKGVGHLTLSLQLPDGFYSVDITFYESSEHILQVLKAIS